MKAIRKLYTNKNNIITSVNSKFKFITNNQKQYFLLNSTTSKERNTNNFQQIKNFSQKKFSTKSEFNPNEISDDIIDTDILIVGKIFKIKFKYFLRRRSSRIILSSINN